MRDKRSTPVGAIPLRLCVKIAVGRKIDWLLLDRWIVGGIIGFDGIPICWKSETFRGVSLAAYCGSNRGRRGDGKGMRVLRRRC
jgi:hypothetical protein